MSPVAVSARRRRRLRWPLAPLLGVPACLRPAAALQDASRTWGDCDPAAVGLGGEPADTAAAAGGVTLRLCGALLLRSAFPAEQVESLLREFLLLPQDTRDALRHGSVRAGREQTHLPFEAPFSELDILGRGQVLLRPLQDFLGAGFALDLATVVAVPPGGPAQEPHRDSPDPGNVAVHIPLHALAESAAPLGLCAGTQSLHKDDAQTLLREAILWRHKGETSQEAKRRLYCGGRQRTQVLNLSISVDDETRIQVADGRLGVRVAAVKPGVDELQVGDEVTHVADESVATDDDWEQAIAAARDRGAGAIQVRLERAVPTTGGEPPPHGLLIGAPLEAGDALLYDSRIFHWGMANLGDSTRYVLYLNFKTGGHAGVHPEAHGTSALHEARSAFQRRLMQLVGAAAHEAEL